MTAIRAVPLDEADAPTGTTWPGTGEPLWVAVRPNLRRIHTLAGDILDGLGKRRDVSGHGRNQSADVSLAAAWTRAHEVDDLVLTGAQYLHPRILDSLIKLACHAQADLWLLHKPPQAEAFVRALERRRLPGHALADVPRASLRRRPSIAIVEADLPPVPHHDFHVFEAATLQTLPVADATRVLEELHHAVVDAWTPIAAAAEPARATARHAVDLLRQALPDNRLTTHLRGLQLAAWHHDVHLSVDLTTLLYSEERPRVPKDDAAAALAAYKQPYRPITWLLADQGLGLDTIAAIPTAAAAPDGATIDTPAGTVTVPDDLRAAVRAQAILRGGHEPQAALLPHSPKALAAALTDAAIDLGLPRHGRIAERATPTDTAWLAKLGIRIRALP